MPENEVYTSFADRFDADGTDPVQAARMSFGDHLDELRTCLVRALIGVAIASALALVFGQGILELVFWPLFMVQQANGMQPRVQSLSPADAFGAYIKVSLLSGLILAMPWVLHQAWRFVAAGLYPREKKFARKLTWASSFLFVFGVAFLFFLVLPIVLQFFLMFNRSFEARIGPTSSFYKLLLQSEPPPEVSFEAPGSIQIPVVPGDAPAEGPNVYVNSQTGRLVVRTPAQSWSVPLDAGTTSPAVFSEFAVHAYLTFVLQLSLAFGLAFETPLVVCFLAWTNLVPVSTMAAARRYVLFGIVVVAAIMTPPDVLSMSLLAGPMYLLFELGIKLARLRSPVDTARA